MPSARRNAKAPVAVKRSEDFNLQECVEKGEKPYFDAMPLIFEQPVIPDGSEVLSYGIAEKFDPRIKTTPWSLKINTFNYYKDPEVD